MRSYAIYEWMYEFDFDSLVELNAYAIIYACSKDGGVCDYSLSQFQFMLKLSKMHTTRVLNSLLAKGLIEKERVFLKNVKRNHYRAFNPADFD